MQVWPENIVRVDDDYQLIQNYTVELETFSLN